MSFKEKYLKYKNKYIHLKKGGSFWSKPNPTPLTRYVDRKITSSEEIIIDGINLKVDKIIFKDSPHNYQEYGMDFPLNTIILLSFSNEVGKKKYIPYFEIYISEGTSFNINKDYIYKEYFDKVPSNVIESYNKIITKYLKIIIEEFKPKIQMYINEISKIIELKEREVKELESTDITIQIKKEKDKRKADIISSIDSDIDKLKQQIQKLEESKISKVSTSDKFIESNYPIEIKRNITFLSENVSRQKLNRDLLLSYLN